MGSSKVEKKEKKEKKRSEVDGVKKVKKEKKEKKEKSEKLANALDEQLQASAAASVGDAVDEDIPDAKVVEVKSKRTPVPPGAIVEFAVPIADDKALKKVLKMIRKGMYGSDASTTLD